MNEEQESYQKLIAAIQQVSIYVHQVNCASERNYTALNTKLDKVLDAIEEIQTTSVVHITLDELEGDSDDSDG